MQIVTLVVTAVFKAEDAEEVELLQREFDNGIAQEFYDSLDALPARTEADIAIGDSHVTLSAGRTIEVDDAGLEDLSPDPIDSDDFKESA